MGGLKSVLKIVAALLGFGLLWLMGPLMIVAALYVAAALGFDMEHNYIIVGIGCGLSVGVLGNFPIRWRGSFDFSSTRFIATSPRRIWDEVFPRTRSDYYSRVIERIDGVPGEPDQFRYTATTFGDTSASADHFIIEVSAAKPHEAFITKPIDLNGLPKWLKNVEWSAWNMVEVEGGTEVSVTERYTRPRITTMLLMFVFSPMRDTLIQLRARCEGTPDKSYAGLLSRMIERDVDAQGQGGASMAVGGLNFWMIAIGVVLPVILLPALVWYILNVLAT